MFLNKYSVLILILKTNKVVLKLATGEQGSATQFQEIGNCSQVYPESTNPIVKNLGGIKFDFANPIDTLKNGIKNYSLHHQIF
jgi:hypothetical protein